LLALAFPAAASAHARLVGSKPADGAVLATPPEDVRLLFDDEIRPAGGDRAVDTAGRSVLAGPARRLGGNHRALVIPMRPGLVRGSYTVRWRVVSNDGHLIEGVLAFAVGTGAPRPIPTLSAGGGTSVASIVLRVLFLAGVLLAGGAALTGQALLEPGRRRMEAAVVGAGLLLVAGGGFGLLALEPAAGATRFGRVTESAAIVALVGAAAAFASIRVRVLGHAASALAAAVLVAPTLAGHALDPHRLRSLVALADFVHVAAAAFWVGGLTLLLLSRSPLARLRFPLLALVAVALLGAAAIPRAIAAFPSLGSVVDTGYGRALLMKTGLLVAVLAVAWLNRARMQRTGFAAELALLAALVVAVAVLTDLRPPSRASAAAAATTSRRPAPPLPDAVVLAGQDGDLAVGFAASPRGRRIAVRVTALGPDGLGVDGLDVVIGGASGTPCGGGCYGTTIPLPSPPRRIAVSVGRASLAFTLPVRWPPPSARALVARTAHTYRSLRTLIIHERLASNARNGIVTTYRVQAPNRLTYRIVNGPEAVIIGATRWDRLPGGAWKRSELEPLTEPEPFWGTDPVRNARLLGTGFVDGRAVSIASFYDPRLRAWFELWVARKTSRLLALRMTAQAHFMRHRYSGFDRPLRIAPPPRSRSTQP
jgi:copper transport protein